MIKKPLSLGVFAFKTFHMDKDTVKKVARLSRIAVTEEQTETLVPELSSILGWMEQLSEINTEGVEPLANVANIDLRLREDVVNDGNIQADVLANAPETMEGFYVVPKVVE
jgi:aspartyl-tRNA(Asn)/glutamyl-tRNA(Gln) amidotransferase subunit C